MAGRHSKHHGVSGHACISHDLMQQGLTAYSILLVVVIHIVISKIEGPNIIKGERGGLERVSIG